MAKQQQKTFISDERNYIALCEPFESPDAANDSMNKFFTELRELRNKYRMRDCLVVVAFNVTYADGETVSDVICDSHFGSSAQQLPMAAFAYGRAQAENRERINKLASGTGLTHLPQ